MPGARRRQGMLLMRLAMGHEVEEQVELNGKVWLDGIGAIACASER